jgi:tRNA(Ile)-lysidine synthase
VDHPGAGLTPPASGPEPNGPALHEVRRAVRAWRAAFLPEGEAVAVALSGGADSLALMAAAAREFPDARALVVDHQLQEGSAQVAERAAALALSQGCAQATVLPVRVTGGGGMEAAARSARYAALEQARAGLPVLLAHTLDDQAETVLLGLGRGSGARSIAGMAPCNPPWGRPLLAVRRSTTHAACVELALPVFADPHNSDPRFARARVRHEVLPLLEGVLGGGVAAALARTAAQLQDDGAVLDQLAAELLVRSRRGERMDTATLAAAPKAVRRRALRLWLLEAGVRGLRSDQVAAVDALVAAWRGQGPVAVSRPRPASVAADGGARRAVVVRRQGELVVEAR